MNRYAHIEARDVAREGGHFCIICQHWSEPDLDAPAGNVCVLCGRPGIRWRPPVNRVPLVRAKELFEQMRLSIEEIPGEPRAE